MSTWGTSPRVRQRNRTSRGKRTYSHGRDSMACTALNCRRGGALSPVADTRSCGPKVVHESASRVLARGRTKRGWGAGSGGAGRTAGGALARASRSDDVGHGGPALRDGLRGAGRYYRLTAGVGGGGRGRRARTGQSGARSRFAFGRRRPRGADATGRPARRRTLLPADGRRWGGGRGRRARTGRSGARSRGAFGRRRPRGADATGPPTGASAATTSGTEA